MHKKAALLACMLLAWVLAFTSTILANTKEPIEEIDPSEGMLIRTGETLESIPLKKTNVKISLIGFIASVDVEQIFTNPYTEEIEAIYIFPLPSESAVDAMEIRIGKRVIRGSVKERTEARLDYQVARNAGHQTALLEQERPNIFTASVANIKPGKKIVVRIHYTERLAYDDGGFRLHFPTVVAPRYIPGNPIGKQGVGAALDTTQVPDASRITPTVLPPQQRPGNISINVDLDIGFPIRELRCISHEIEEREISSSHYKVKLAKHDEIPNKDFILEYKIAGEKLQATFMQAVNKRGQGYFLLMATPTAVAEVDDMRPKEVILIIDTSGSMAGEKLAQAKRALSVCLESLNPQDAFNIVRFSTGFKPMWESSLPVTPGNLTEAKAYIKSLEVDGGTEMLPPLLYALEQPPIDNKLRLIVFFTDGQVGNEAEILQQVKLKLAKSRIFTFGIDTAVNEYFLKKLAQIGRGTVEFLHPEQQDIEPAIERFRKRIYAPMLTDLAIDWGGLIASDVTPNPLPDLYLNQPVFVIGKFLPNGHQPLQISGQHAQGLFSLPISVDATKSTVRAKTLASLWARAQIEQLSDLLIEKPNDTKLKNQITQLALTYQLLSPFTSFVATDLQTVGAAKKPRQISVPVALPSGWSHSNVTKTPKLSSMAAIGKATSTNTSALAHNQVLPTSPKAATTTPATTLTSNSANRPAIIGRPINTNSQTGGTSSINSLNRITLPTQPAAPIPVVTATVTKPEPSTDAYNPVGNTLDLTNSNSVLHHLVRQQSASGGWGNTVNANSLRATALATLALIAHGHTSDRGRYQQAVRRGINYLITNIDADGILQGSRGQDRQTEIQALALWALTENLHSSSNEEYRKAAQMLFTGLLKLREPDGIWRSRESGKESMRATAWTAFALTSSRRAGVGDSEQLLQIATLTAARSKYRLEHALITLLAGQPEKSEKLDELKRNLLVNNWGSGRDLKLSKAFFALVFLHEVDGTAYNKLTTQISGITLGPQPSVISLALRELTLSANVGTLVGLP
ncbi:MAG: marine proteobacterial sortase target protein [Acidobacteriota bacterium]